MFGSPLRVQTTDHVGRQALGFFAQQHLQRIAHVAGQDAFQVQPRQRRRDARRFPDIGRDDGRVEFDAVSGTVTYLRHLDCHEPCSGQYAAFGQVAVRIMARVPFRVQTLSYCSSSCPNSASIAWPITCRTPYRTRSSTPISIPCRRVPVLVYACSW